VQWLLSMQQLSCLVLYYSLISCHAFCSLMFICHLQPDK